MDDHMNRRALLKGGAALVAAPLAATAFAQEAFPRGRTVTLVCPWAPGGIADTTARRIAQALSAAWSTQVVVDNRAGANGNIGSAAVARAAPDGHTLLLTLHDGMVTAKAARFQIGYDPLADLSPLALVGVSDIYWTVAGDSPHRTIADFIAFARANPGKVYFGSNGVGSSPHLAMELLNASAGIQIVHVPFRGGAQAVPEVMAGRVQAFMATPALGLGHFRSGTLRPIALVGAQRSPLFPEMPTIAESGHPDVSVSIGVGIFGPRGLPRQVVETVNQTVRRHLNTPEVRAKFMAEGFPPADLSPTEYEAMLAKEVVRMEPLVKRVNFQQS